MRRIAVMLLVLFATTSYGEDLRPVVAVFDIQVKRVRLGKVQRGMLTELMASELGLGGGFQIMPPGDVKRELLHQSRESYKACFDEKCQIELGRQLPANKLVTTSVLKIGKTCRVTASLYDLKRQTTDIVAKEKSGCKLDDLALAVEAVASQLRGKPADRSAASVAPPKKPDPPPSAIPMAEMALVPAGRFAMGCTSENYTECFLDEYPGRFILLGAFYIDKTEVTVEQYAACVQAGKCREPSTGNKLHKSFPKLLERYNWGKPGREQHPVDGVSWNDATAYCSWAGKRLPTSAEWEKAARGAKGRFYPWGNRKPTCRHVKTEKKYTVCCGKELTDPVCSYRRGNSPYGLCDMAGNVSEWVSDWYLEKYYEKVPYENPQGPATGTKRVHRGGSTCNGWYFLRASKREQLDPGETSFGLGFRCARSP